MATNQELIYTSAPRGLQAGSRGFCTVASTSGMAKNLADFLEGLSGYRHLYPPATEQAHRNPVVHSYVTARVGGKQIRVLSRIADAGLDYSNRSNKIAHHIVVETQRPAAGPAWLLSQSGVTETSWSGEPRKLAGRTLPSTDSTNVNCQYWQEVTGDAGWAGDLAHSFLQGKTAFVIFEPGTDMLRLFAESQSLLPANKRWECTFTTYFTKFPPNVRCQWRAVVAGSPEAKLAMRSRGALVLNLSHLAAPASPLAEYARRGEQPDLQQIGSETLMESSQAADQDATPAVVPVDSTSLLELAEDQCPTLAPPSLRMQSRLVSESSMTSSSKKSLKRRRILVSIGVCAGVLGTALIIVAFVNVNFSSFIGGGIVKRVGSSAPSRDRGNERQAIRVKKPNKVGSPNAASADSDNNLDTSSSGSIEADTNRSEPPVDSDDEQQHDAPNPGSSANTSTKSANETTDLNNQKPSTSDPTIAVSTDDTNSTSNTNASSNNKAHPNISPGPTTVVPIRNFKRASDIVTEQRLIDENCTLDKVVLFTVDKDIVVQGNNVIWRKGDDEAILASLYCRNNSLYFDWKLDDASDEDRDYAYSVLRNAIMIVDKFQIEFRDDPEQLGFLSLTQIANKQQRTFTIDYMPEAFDDYAIDIDIPKVTNPNIEIIKDGRKLFFSFGDGELEDFFPKREYGISFYVESADKLADQPKNRIRIVCRDFGEPQQIKQQTIQAINEKIVKLENELSLDARQNSPRNKAKDRKLKAMRKLLDARGKEFVGRTELEFRSLFREVEDLVISGQLFIAFEDHRLLVAKFGQHGQDQKPTD